MYYQTLNNKKMEDLKIGDVIFHPCSIDIIKHKIVSIRQYEGFCQYVLKSVAPVGACGIIEVIVDSRKGKFKFLELIDEDEIQYSSGLQDFVAGNYYTSLELAKREFYKNQEILAWSNMEEKERLYKEAKKRYEQIKLIIEQISKK